MENQRPWGIFMYMHVSSWWRADKGHLLKINNASIDKVFKTSGKFPQYKLQKYPMHNIISVELHNM